MRLYYDLHIHTALSPCAEDDMTPNNIVNMALLKGLDIIAIADHNSARAAGEVIKAARGKGLLVLPALEIETAEEVHILCYFAGIDEALEMERAARATLPKIKNRPEIFGRQIYYDSRDNIIGEEEQMLITASALSVEEVCAMARGLGGAPVPAHIDRDAYGIISKLGAIPGSLGFAAVELSKGGAMPEGSGKYLVLKSSDAHSLGQISERENSLVVSDKKAQDIIDIL